MNLALVFVSLVDIIIPLSAALFALFRQWVYNKTCLKRSFKRSKLALKTNYRLMKVKSNAECSKSILQYFRPALSYHFLSIFEWPFRQVLLYTMTKKRRINVVVDVKW